MSLFHKKTFGEKVFDVCNYTLLTLIALICLYPMLYVLFSSVSDPLQLMKFRGFLYKPLGFTLKGYEVLLHNPNIPIGYLNTIFYVVIGTCLNLFVTMLGAYALSRTGYKLKKLFTIAIVFTMYFGGGMIPNFLLVRNIGLINTRWALVLPTLIGTWNMIVMRTIFAAVPKSLEESAKMDGANDFVVLFKIFIPVSKATIAVMLLFYAVGHWNSWFNAMIYLRDRQLWPLQLFMREIIIANTMIGNETGAVSGEAGQGFFYLEEVIKYATIIVSTVPILCIYPFIQKYFTKGIMLGSLKG
ncbi:MAG: carbohydrate ABC transporter permease [Firmicutes bacterium]|nr:carbohydrate ABC transporter permease [Bacillota bacterium]